MHSWFSKKESTSPQSLRYKLIIIEAFVFGLPLLVVSYVFYQGGYHFEISHLLLFAFIVLLILAGMIMLRQIFDRIISMAKILKQTEKNCAIPNDFHKDVEELKDISLAFHAYIEKFNNVMNELNQRTLELIAIRELEEFSRKSLNLQELMNYLLDKAVQVTRAQRGSVFLFDSLSRSFRIIASKGIDFPSDEMPTLSLDSSIVKPVVEGNTTLIVEDVEKDPRINRSNNPRYANPSFISLPILVKNEVIGVLNLAAKESGTPFNENDERVLAIMLAEAGFAVENAMLHEKVKKQNEELEAANKKLWLAYMDIKKHRDSILESIEEEDIAFIMNSEGFIEGMTERALEMTQSSRYKLVGTQFVSLLDEEFRSIFEEERKRALFGLASPVTVKFIPPCETDKSFTLKMTRLTYDGRKSLIALLR